MTEILSITGCYPVTVNCGSCKKKPEDIDPILYLFMSVGSCIARSLKLFYIERDITEPMMSVSLSFDTSNNCNILYVDVKPTEFNIDLLLVHSFAETITDCSIVKLLNMEIKVTVS